MPAPAATSPAMGHRGRRVAITGYGVVAPCGLGKQAFWAGLNGPGITTGRTVEMVDWDPSPYFANPKESRRRQGGAVRAGSGRRVLRTRREAHGRRRPIRHHLRHRCRRPALHRRADRGAHREGRTACVAVPGADDDAQRCRRRHLHALRLARPQRNHHHRLRSIHPCHRLRGTAHRLGDDRRASPAAARALPAPSGLPRSAT